jgi:hypothetical protein
VATYGSCVGGSCVAPKGSTDTSPFSKKRKNWFSRAQEVLFPARVIKLADAKFAKYQKELDRRLSIVAGGLTSIGLQVTQLDTQHLIELYYQLYNPTRGTNRTMPAKNIFRDWNRVKTVLLCVFDKHQNDDSRIFVWRTSSK